MIRRIERELLDDLPPEHPDALRERRDLLRINAWMGNPGIMTHALKKTLPVGAPLKLVEIGAGGGEFLLNIAKRWGEVRDVEATLVDQQDLLRPETRSRFAELGWRVSAAKMDVFDWAKNCPPSDAVLANLFLHHFTEHQLRELFTRAAAATQIFIAVEPWRRWQALFFCRWLWVIGCGAVTQHDAKISVRAGFSGKELSALWPDRENWELTESSRNFASHLFIARRKRSA